MSERTIYFFLNGKVKVVSKMTFKMCFEKIFVVSVNLIMQDDIRISFRKISVDIISNISIYQHFTVLFPICLQLEADEDKQMTL